MNVFYQLVGMLLVIVILAGCDGKKSPRTIKNLSDRAGGKVEKQQLENSLKDFKPEVIAKGVKPLDIADIARMTNEIALKMGKKPIMVGDGEGYMCDFSDHSLAVFLAEYSRLTGKTVIQEADEPAEGITFKLDEVLPVEEAAHAMESFLAEKLNIVIIADEAGDLKAVKRKTGDR